MKRAARFSVSVEPELLRAFDALSKREGAATRSEAVKRLMRHALVEREWEEGATVAGALVLVYDHHRGDLLRKLTKVQHDFAETVISTQHVHLDHDNCLEVVTLRGDAAELRKLVNAVRGVKGLKHHALVTTTTGKDIT
jgi:CopG family nickel-responsive transcriptional regulator